MTAKVSEDLKAVIGPPIGRLASGVYIVTTRNDGKPDGMLATWINQASFEPPCLSVAVNKEREIYSHLKEGTAFSINVLSKANMDIFKCFAKPHEPGLDRFEGLKLLDLPADKPPVFSDCVAYLEARVKSIAAVGDHDLIIGEIKDGKVFDQDNEPMVHFRKSGFQY